MLERSADGSDAGYAAVAAGFASLRCVDPLKHESVIRYEVARVVRIAIRRAPPRASVGARFSVDVVGIDDRGRDLELGSQFFVDQTGALGTPRADHMDVAGGLLRVFLGGVWIEATRPGTGTIAARFGDLTDAVEVEVSSPAP